MDRELANVIVNGVTIQLIYKNNEYVVRAWEPGDDQWTFLEGTKFEHDAWDYFREARAKYQGEK